MGEDVVCYKFLIALFMGCGALSIVVPFWGAYHVIAFWAGIG